MPPMKSWFRYKETRRAHPMAMDGLVTEGIRKERNAGRNQGGCSVGY